MVSRITAVGAADDDVHRGRVGEHRQSPLDDFVPRRQLWQVQSCDYVRRAILRFGELFLQAGEDQVQQKPPRWL